MTKKIYKENVLYRAMVQNIDEEAVAYGANGHYAVGAYYDITKINSAIAGDKDYNNKSNFENNKEKESVKQFLKTDEHNDELKKDIYHY